MTLSLNTQCPAAGVGSLDSLVTTLVQALFVAQCSLSNPEHWPSDYGDEALQPGSLDGFDFVVIGAGTAGSVIASRLSENPNWNVLVLEHGGNPPVESEVPNLLFNLQQSDFVYNYFTENTGNVNLALKNNASYLIRGKCIGGSGALNGMLHTPGNRKDYDDWLTKGNPSWGWDDVLPYFEKSLQHDGNESISKGYLTLNEFGHFYPDVEDMIYAGAKELGTPHVKRFEDGSEIGYANVPGTVKDGQRTTAGKSYLGRVSNRPNLRVIKNAQATRINFSESGKKVESISFLLRNKYKLNVRVKKEFILSAGTVDSAKLLLLSGVGPQEHLKSLKLPVTHNLQVGDNLQDHLFVPLFFKIPDDKSISEKDTLDNIYNYLIHRDGPLSSYSILSLTAFVNSIEGSESPYPDIEYHHFFFRRGDLDGIHLYERKLNFKEIYNPYLDKIVEEGNLMITYVTLSRPKSTGSIRLRSANYADQPKITPNYLSEEEDIHTLLRGIQRQMKMEDTKAYKLNKAEIQHIPIEECDQYEFKTDIYWRCYMKYFTNTIYHQSGTVKMGPQTDPTACVSPRLKLHGVDNLRVAGASIMPDITSANPNTPTVMIAEKASDFIAEDWSEHH